MTGIVSTWALPRLMQPRIQGNERAVLALLRMQATAQSVWKARLGRYASLREVVFSPPEDRTEFDENPSFRRPLLPSRLYPDRDGLALRAGYFFAQSFVGRKPVGTWAWPKLEKYSGYDTYWLDYASGRIFRAPAGVPPGYAPPAPDSLGPEAAP